MIFAMESRRHRRFFGRRPNTTAIQTTLPLALEEESTLFKTMGWVSAGLGAVALGLIVGNKIRQRYQFNRRTPYDVYGHSGDETHDMDFGLGI